MNKDFIVLGNVGGYYDENGRFIVCEEYNCSDADLDKYSEDVQNGIGYYSSNGNFVKYNTV